MIITVTGIATPGGEPRPRGLFIRHRVSIDTQTHILIGGGPRPQFITRIQHPSAALGVGLYSLEKPDYLCDELASPELIRNTQNHQNQLGFLLLFSQPLYGEIENY